MLDPWIWLGETALRWALALLFLYIGINNLRHDARQEEEFQRWGYPTWVRPAGGVIQIVCSALLVPTGTAAYGAAVLFGLMIFSVYSHLGPEFHPREAVWPGFLALVSLLVLFLTGSAAWGLAGVAFRILFPWA